MARAAEPSSCAVSRTNAPQIAPRRHRNRDPTPLTRTKDRANVAIDDLAWPRQSALVSEEALKFALFLTNATNQPRFAAEEAPVSCLPQRRPRPRIESRACVASWATAQEELVRRARAAAIPRDASRDGPSAGARQAGGENGCKAIL